MLLIDSKGASFEDVKSTWDDDYLDKSIRCLALSMVSNLSRFMKLFQMWPRTSSSESIDSVRTSNVLLVSNEESTGMDESCQKIKQRSSYETSDSIVLTELLMKKLSSSVVSSENATNRSHRTI